MRGEVGGGLERVGRAGKVSEAIGTRVDLGADGRGCVRGGEGGRDSCWFLCFHCLFHSWILVPNALCDGTRDRAPFVSLSEVNAIQSGFQPEMVKCECIRERNMTS